MSREEASSSPVILIVDDEVCILSALRRCLRREGYDILIAEGPTAALALLEERSVDLIISDQKMPVMSGIELLREAKRLRPEATRMLITGWSEVVRPDDLDDLGICEMIPKPWDDARLKEIIRKACVSRMPRDPAAPL